MIHMYVCRIHSYKHIYTEEEDADWRCLDPQARMDLTRIGDQLYRLNSYFK